MHALADAPLLKILFTEGDRLPELTGFIKSVDLTDCTVTLTLARPEDTLEKTATIIDAAAGKFSFEWAEGDIVAGIGQVGVIRMTDDDELTMTLLRFTLDVGEIPAP